MPLITVTVAPGAFPPAQTVDGGGVLVKMLSVWLRIDRPGDGGICRRTYTVAVVVLRTVSVVVLAGIVVTDVLVTVYVVWV